MAAPARPKPLSRLKHSGKGEIHHIEIHPAINSRGKRAFITRTFRKPSPAAQAAADKAGRYLPDQMMDAETPHEDGADMLQHVANSYGIPHPADEDEEEDA